MDKDSIMQALREADMVLVGLGEEFDGTSYLGQDPSYQQGRQWLEKEQEGWMVPAWMEYCLDKTGREDLEEAVGKLTHILEGHNYFVISINKPYSGPCTLEGGQVCSTLWYYTWKAVPERLHAGPCPNDRGGLAGPGPCL